MSYSSILVIKVGTSTLSNVDIDGIARIDQLSFKRIAEQARILQQEGQGIVIVSSAAITAGMTHTSTAVRPAAMPELQRMASIGWRLILNTWAESFGSLNAGELLVTKHELTRPDESNELVKVIDQLLSHQDICLINENDALTHDEIAFGDNDTLAAHVAALLKKRLQPEQGVRFVILSDIDGVYADKENPETLLSEISDINKVSHLARGVESNYGTGGMVTKFQAVRIALEGGVETWIGRGKREQVIKDMFLGKTGTHFS